MSALIQTTFVADDLAWIQGGASPAWWLSLGTIEASATKILSFLRGGIISMLNGETRVRREIGHRMHGTGRRWAIKAGLRRYDDGGRLF
jgi:hypothetical protein